MTRWLFGDQLGPWFMPPDGEPVIMIESRAALRRRRWHRQKLHLLLSAMRHRAAELGERAISVRATGYRAGLAETGSAAGAISVCEPSSHAAEAFIRTLGLASIEPHPGFATSRAGFTGWAGGRGERRLLLEDFYRWQRRRHGVLLEPDGEPAGGRWNFDADNREPPPGGMSTLGVAPPYLPVEDDIDAEVRDDLDRWTREGSIHTIGDDGPRWWAATRDEALAALDTFVRTRLASFGPHEDAMLGEDPTMSHSLLAAPMNLGLLHPLEAVRAAEDAYRAGSAPLASVEGFIRQVLGWREYVWGLYHLLGDDYRHRNELDAHEELPSWLETLDADREVRAECLRVTLRDVRERGWTHHIPRLMILGNYALQRGIDPASITGWFHRAFVDGYDWVMVPNVVGMSQWADGGVMATKPYVAGGAYLDRMSDHCGRCPYDPRRRTGPLACPFTAGYWAFLDRRREDLRGNHRMTRALAGLARRTDLQEIVEQERRRGTAAP
jgi:deoxyribodipyrimidine photolyase-related protein